MPQALKLTDTKPAKASPWRFPFTVARLDALRPPANGRTWVYDERCPGLALMLTDTGHRAYYLYRKVGKQPVRLRLGAFADITLDDARTLCERHKGDIAKGDNPADAKRLARSAATFGEAFKVYIAVHKKPTSKTWKLDEQRYELYLKTLANRPLKEIQTEDILTVRNRVATLTSNSNANRVMALASSVFNKITHKAYNPVRGVERFAEKPRDRFLSKSEVAALMAALDTVTPDIADLIRLGIGTGARRGNICAMRWQDVNLADGLWSIPETKSGQPLTVPIQGEALAVLTRRKLANDAKSEPSPWVFPSHGTAGHLIEPAASWRKIAKAAGLEGVRFHDLRRTYASFMAMSGASLGVTQRAMGHLTSITTAKHYTRVNVEAVREAGAKAAAMMFDAPAAAGAQPAKPAKVRKAKAEGGAK